jgi:hypothetical protein
MARQTNPKLLADFFNKIGPTRTSNDVRVSVAIRCKADIERTEFNLPNPRRFGSICQKADTRRRGKRFTQQRRAYLNELLREGDAEL